jgi:hypothetical protein
MSEQPSGDQADSTPRTKVGLLERIDRSFTRLEQLVRSLTSEQLTNAGPSGWSVKDHLAHLAVWELSVVEHLNGRGQYAAMPFDEDASLGMSEEEENDQIYHQYRDLTLSEVMDLVSRTHQEMVRTLETLEDADLVRPYVSFLPEGSTGRSGGRSSGSQNPVLYTITGNTYEHYDEHYGWIQSQVNTHR